MNIIKLNDILMQNDANPKLAEFFNNELKGKYAYWVKMRYIFPLDSLTYSTYIEYEQKDHIYFLGENILPHIDMYSEDECLYDFVNIYVDVCETEKINSIQQYYAANKYAIDFDLDINKLRSFRTWLAECLYNANIKEDGSYGDLYTTDQMHILDYYKNGMYNDIVKYLSIFGKEQYSVNTNNTSCGCCSNNLSELYNISINTCDALNIYRNNMHIMMVSMFKDIAFWSILSKNFLKLFKKYIDNIIKSGMIVTSNNVIYTECECNYSNSSTNENILKNLSIALEYIITDTVSGHINYIQDTLYNWADSLYDNMSWEIK